ncbi:hypothetical protein OLMES_3100 [Oleiphilus messinensis]|uniref:EVE domain-containing protein n=1 Tax=Oleiphilus messinensis TaxID=141451 RepID=A0A1Y0ICN6_9GAMM|nr:EVE domain-containing protein [Oleiphilus messinensis]ARU57143.1 hypothetical protein OLMES_3100 [Oleiphilus messinensis]
MNYWIMKSEPDVFGIDDLLKQPDKTACWDGVRNFQARNFIRDEMQSGQQAFFYHSSCKTPGVAGIVEICSAAYPDPTSLDSEHENFDPKSVTTPRWFAVDVRFVSKFKRIITLPELKSLSAFADSPLTRRGNRLSILPLTDEQWSAVIAVE